MNDQRYAITDGSKLTTEQWARYLDKMRRLAEMLESRCAHNPPPWAKAYAEMVRLRKIKGDENKEIA